MVLRVVVLPAPLLPRRATISPRSTREGHALEGVDLAVVDVQRVNAQQRRLSPARPALAARPR